MFFKLSIVFYQRSDFDKFIYIFEIKQYINYMELVHMDCSRWKYNELLLTYLFTSLKGPYCVVTVEYLLHISV